MAYVPVEDTAMVELFYRLQGEQAENTLYFLKVGGWSLSDLTDLAIAMAGWFEDDLAPLLSNELTLVGIKCTDLSTQFAPAVDYPVAPAVPGTQGSDPMPNNCAVVVSFRTAARGRSFRGRNYIPGFPEASVNGNTLANSDVTAFIAAYTALSDVETSQGCTHVVVSRESLGVPRVAGLATEVIFTLCDETIRTQRRRLPR